MHPLIAAIVEVGGAAGRRHLTDRGFTDRELRAAVRAGVIQRARRGWYTVWPRGDSRFAALRLGGRLTGLAAIEALGGWVLRPPRLEVAVPRNASRLRDPHRRRPLQDRSRRGVTVHWVAQAHDRDTSSGIVPVAEALRVVIREETREVAIAAVDWALRTGALDHDGLAGLARSIPRPLVPRLREADALCDSLPESLARSRLRAAGLQVRSQVEVEGAGPIDLVIEGVVALEVDGDRFHRDRFEQDRAKDLVITAAGMHVLRPSARHVFDDWSAVVRAVRRALRERGALPPGQDRPVRLRRNTRARSALPSA